MKQTILNLKDQRFKDLNKIKWRKAREPKVWRPEATGETLLGYYKGKTKKDGNYGQYELVQVDVPGECLYLISGTILIQIVDAAQLEIGAPIKIVYLGKKTFHGSEKSLKLFDVFVE